MVLFASLIWFRFFYLQISDKMAHTTTVYVSGRFASTCMALAVKLLLLIYTGQPHLLHHLILSNINSHLAYILVATFSLASPTMSRPMVMDFRLTCPAMDWSMVTTKYAVDPSNIHPQQSHTLGIGCHELQVWSAPRWPTGCRDLHVVRLEGV